MIEVPFTVVTPGHTRKELFFYVLFELGYRAAEVLNC